VNDNAKNNVLSRSTADIDSLFQNLLQMQKQLPGNAAGIYRPIPTKPIGRR
jgi:hypothetical protein